MRLTQECIFTFIHSPKENQNHNSFVLLYVQNFVVKNINRNQCRNNRSRSPKNEINKTYIHHCCKVNLTQIINKNKYLIVRGSKIKTAKTNSSIQLYNNCINYSQRWGITLIAVHSFQTNCKSYFIIYSRTNGKYMKYYSPNT